MITHPRLYRIHSPPAAVKSSKRLLQQGSNHVSLLVMKNSRQLRKTPASADRLCQKRSNSPSSVLAVGPFDPAGLRAERVFAALSSDGRPGVP